MDTVFTVESALEFDACFHLEYSHDITSYEAQPEGFIYEFNGRPCPYTPDFKINHAVNGFQFLEIKPVEKTNDPDFIKRFKAKRAQATKNGISLILVVDLFARKAIGWAISLSPDSLLTGKSTEHGI